MEEEGSLAGYESARGPRFPSRCHTALQCARYFSDATSFSLRSLLFDMAPSCEKPFLKQRCWRGAPPVPEPVLSLRSTRPRIWTGDKRRQGSRIGSGHYFPQPPAQTRFDLLDEL